MPDTNDPNNGPPNASSFFIPVMTTVCVLLLMLILVIRRLHRYQENEEQQPPAITDWRTPITHSLRRGNFSRQTIDTSLSSFGNAQAQALGNQNPSALEIQTAAENFDGIRGGAFHLRHVVADNFLRRAVQSVLNSRLDERMAVVRAVFVAMNANTLVATWDTVVQRLQNGRADRNWYQILGATHVRDLRTGLNNTVGQLFYSNQQTNLLAGTNIDVTGDTIGVLGEERVSALVSSATDLMESLNLRPRLIHLEGEILLGYTGSSGAYRRYGYDSRRHHDTPEDALRLMSHGQSLRALSRSDLSVVLRYLVLYRRREVLAGLLVILWSIWYDFGFPALNWE
ncbi:hypothetical protein [Pseudomonas gingeri]|uniref:Uncharacterized protein n=1 Tax=Pseudomonas gingeri TaxID=117681 RepID=A0A7Y8CNP8_9PSED|nr:hypothetical protein [Pseudomonas gingeri]NWB31160.1 hypothetical protein [Pseudomonas gingeri]NWC37055.1 hypothetical protein [Pseudomonas gingeri]